jgi:hypothetical protein
MITTLAKSSYGWMITTLAKSSYGWSSLWLYLPHFGSPMDDSHFDCITPKKPLRIHWPFCFLILIQACLSHVPLSTE